MAIDILGIGIDILDILGTLVGTDREFGVRQVLRRVLNERDRGRHEFERQHPRTGGRSSDPAGKNGGKGGVVREDAGRLLLHLQRPWDPLRVRVRVRVRVRIRVRIRVRVRVRVRVRIGVRVRTGSWPESQS